METRLQTWDYAVEESQEEKFNWNKYNIRIKMEMVHIGYDKIR